MDDLKIITNQWTPGPWYYIRDYDYYYIGPNGERGAVIGGKDNSEGNEADYHLIAAAPEMAAALDDALFALEIYYGYENPEWDGHATPDSTIGVIRALLNRIHNRAPDKKD